MPLLIAIALAVAFFVWRAWGRERASNEVSWRMGPLDAPKALQVGDGARRDIKLAGV
jgi:hypothetical protein